MLQRHTKKKKKKSLLGGDANEIQNCVIRDGLESCMEDTMLIKIVTRTAPGQNPM